MLLNLQFKFNLINTRNVVFTKKNFVLEKMPGPQGPVTARLHDLNVFRLFVVLLKTTTEDTYFIRVNEQALKRAAKPQNKRSVFC